ncbi:SRPBCC domain-containing protein [Agromyces larvae]|uniref:SRPBCC domain-containing protein n=1 Tax=Agromyces larvae TaxID=2929802 RepID=A0ABY4BWP3_9MICO|nr:SRPBCC domain-containing protein [Agromyces larvae]UOE43608.1 SRPBCC domain-containing protein [Agromyces larvae]
MNAKPTGHYVTKGDELRLQFDRLFHAPIEDVWYSLTNPTATGGWIGTWTGSPSTGGILFKMTAEDPDADWMSVSVLECEPPHRFRLHVGSGDDTRRLHCHVREAAGGLTTLVFQERVIDPSVVADIGPGWDYYLDRLTAFRAGQPMPEWNDYLALQRHYRELPVPRTAAR